MQQLVECVPNFSNGRDPQVYDRIAATIAKIKGVTVLDVSAELERSQCDYVVVLGDREVRAQDPVVAAQVHVREERSREVRARDVEVALEHVALRLRVDRRLPAPADDAGKRRHLIGRPEAVNQRAVALEGQVLRVDLSPLSGAVIDDAHVTVELLAVPVDEDDTPEMLADYTASRNPAYRMLAGLGPTERTAFVDFLEEATGAEPALPTSVVTTADGSILAVNVPGLARSWRSSIWSVGRIWPLAMGV